MLQVDVHLGFAEDPDRPVPGRPVGCGVLVHPPHRLLADERNVADHRLPSEALTGDGAGGHAPGGGLEIDIGDPRLHVRRRVGRCRSETGRHHLDGFGEQAVEPATMADRRRLECLRGGAEVHHLEHDLGRRVPLEVADLLDLDAVDPQRQSRHQQREQVAEPPGIRAGAVKRRTARLARCGQPTHHLVAVHLGIHVADRGHDVFARGEQPTEVVHVGVGSVAVHQRRQRHVEDDVGVECEDLVEVVGGTNPDLGDAGDVADVTTDLARVGDHHPHQFHVRMRRDGADRMSSHIAAAPLDHANRHGSDGRRQRGTRTPSAVEVGGHRQRSR